MYFSQVRIDPNNDQRIWVAGVNMAYSEDGGKTFVDESRDADSRRFSRHLDRSGEFGQHDRRLRRRHPFQPRRRALLGCARADRHRPVLRDRLRHGEAVQSVRRACRTTAVWCGPSATTNIRGITNEDWYTVAGGDGFYAQIDPEEPWIVYAESQDGNLVAPRSAHA